MFGFRDLVVLVAVVVAVPLALFRPWMGLLVYTMIGFLNPHRMTWELKGVSFAFWVAVAVLVGLLLTRDRKAIPWTRELTLMVLLAVYFTLTTFLAWAPDAAWPQWEKVMKIYLMICVMGMLIYGKLRIRALMWVAVLGIGFFGFKGGIFSLLTGGQHQVLGPEGSFIEGNTSLGLALVMIIPVMICMARHEEQRWVRLGLRTAAFFSFVATIFTYSRGAWLGLAAIVPFILLRAKARIVFIAFATLLGVLGVGFLPTQVFDRASTLETYDQDGSAVTRLQAWSVSWNVGLEHPLTGAGFEFENYPDPERWLAYADRQYDMYRTPRAAHSIYLQVLGQHGFVAFGLFIALLISTMLSFWQLRWQARGDPSLAWVADYALGMQIGMIGYLVAGAFLNLAYFDLFYLYVGMIGILRREIKERKAAKAAEVKAAGLAVATGGELSRQLPTAEAGKT